VDLPDVSPRAEPASRQGNGPEYRQSGRTYRVLETSEGYDEEGTASWYGREFHGRPTATGETFDMNQVSGAHRTLPLPVHVEVTNLENGRRVVVRLNDRGPFADVGSRIVDVSYAAAVALDMVSAGTVRVRVRAVGPPQRRPGDEAPMDG
jgi:rare lipoprotein A